MSNYKPTITFNQEDEKPTITFDIQQEMLKDELFNSRCQQLTRELFDKLGDNGTLKDRINFICKLVKDYQEKYIILKFSGDFPMEAFTPELWRVTVKTKMIE
jgi:hypothetical protein